VYASVQKIKREQHPRNANLLIIVDDVFSRLQKQNFRWKYKM